MWRLDDGLLQRLYARAGADRWSVATDAFASFLLASARREFGEQPPDAQRLERHCSALPLEDLALACACAEGIETAWDEFILRYRPVLYRAADALDPSGGAREVADSLYGELYGLRSRTGERQSHLRYFHGRSSLATWLRAVLAQRYVDRKRFQARMEPLPEEENYERLASTPSHSSTHALQRFTELVRHAIASVIAALAPRDRLRLRCYYSQEMTLAQIGKLLGESEATASRSLGRTRRTIRDQVEQRLRAQGMSEAEISDGFAAVTEDAGSLDLAELFGAQPVLEEQRKEGAQDRSK